MAYAVDPASRSAHPVDIFLGKEGRNMEEGKQCECFTEALARDAYRLGVIYG